MLMADLKVFFFIDIKNYNKLYWNFFPKNILNNRNFTASENEACKHYERIAIILIIKDNLITFETHSLVTLPPVGPYIL